MVLGLALTPQAAKVSTKAKMILDFIVYKGLNGSKIDINDESDDKCSRILRNFKESEVRH